MMYADRYPIQFRQNVMSGEIEMRVDDAMAKANGYADLNELKALIAEHGPSMPIPEWLRVDDWDLILRVPFNLN
jgi:hypothetical protein